MNDEQRLAHLRSMLNDPERDAASILEHLNTWDDDHARQIAARYARDYFERHEPSNLAPPTRFHAESNMLFDPETKTLFTNHGEEIKQLECPKTKCWDELEVLDETDLKRRCSDCAKNVVDTRDLTDLQVQALVQYDPSICLHIDTESGNVSLVGSRDSPLRIVRGGAPGQRVIKTAWTQSAINRAAAKGLWPLLRFARPSGRIRSFMRAWQNQRTGEVAIQHDMRNPNIHGDYSEWTLMGGPDDPDDYGSDPSDHFPEPIAAYLIPPDLEVGERVHLQEVIENFIAYHHQGSVRLVSATAIWNGSDLEIDYDETRDVTYAIG